MSQTSKQPRVEKASFGEAQTLRSTMHPTPKTSQTLGSCGKEPYTNTTTRNDSATRGVATLKGGTLSKAVVVKCRKRGTAMHSETHYFVPHPGPVYCPKRIGTLGPLTSFSLLLWDSGGRALALVWQVLSSNACV